MLATLVLCAVCAASAASAEEPHDHHGKLTPYSIGPPSVTLSRTDEASLAEGKPLMQTIIADDQSSRRMVVVQDVPAPAGVVMECAAALPPPHPPHAPRPPS